MIFPLLSIEHWTMLLVGYLWQLTVITLVALLLTLALCGNEEDERHWGWRIAPISVLVLLAFAATAAVSMFADFGFVHGSPVYAQTADGNLPRNIIGTWQGTLHVGKELRMVIKISKLDKDAYNAVFFSIDQDGAPLPVSSTTLQGTTVKMSLSSIGGSYEGKLSADGRTIEGKWIQGSNALPLTLERATPGAEWTIPEPSPAIPPMAADASPTFEVATIRPSRRDEQRKFLTVQGLRMMVVNYSLRDLASFAYEVHSKQIQTLPAWADDDKFDITAQPDGEGRPNEKQLKVMIQKLLADRFKFRFHYDKKELSVYVLSVSKTGPKLTKSAGDPNGSHTFGFLQFGALVARNASMSNFCILALQGIVLDRPVLDQTGIVGKYDFTLNWSPDSSQFPSSGMMLPSLSDNESVNAPPSLYTAIQEQLGLKLELTKALADVLVIDHAEKPSSN